MLRQALLHLFDEIERIPEAERTTAAQSLLLDLQDLKPTLESMAISVRIPTRERLRIALLTDLSPPSTPIWRCSRSDCPNKKKKAP
jgi:hypothetical protein